MKKTVQINYRIKHPTDKDRYLHLVLEKEVTHDVLPIGTFYTSIMGTIKKHYYDDDKDILKMQAGSDIVTTIEDAKYYKEKLIKKGWEVVNSDIQL